MLRSAVGKLATFFAGFRGTNPVYDGGHPSNLVVKSFEKNFGWFICPKGSKSLRDLLQ